LRRLSNVEEDYLLARPSFFYNENKSNYILSSLSTLIYAADIYYEIFVLIDIYT